jgi:hypothetical protein
LPGVGLARYTYSDNDPVNKSDANGHVFETAWDAFSLALGIASFQDNVGNGKYGAAVLDAVGIAIDVAAAAVPGVPGGAGAGIAAGRGAGRAASGASRTSTDAHAASARAESKMDN